MKNRVILSIVLNSDCLMYAARIRARRRETRSGKDITGLSRMTRKTRPQTGIIRRVRPLRMRVHMRLRVPVRKQVRFIYRVRIGEILRWRREILSAMQLFLDGY